MQNGSNAPRPITKTEANLTRITRGTTNVFADLGYADAAERQTKTRLALAVNELLKARKLKQREMDAQMVEAGGIEPPSASPLQTDLHT